MCVCVSATLVSAVKVMRCIQCSQIIIIKGAKEWLNEFMNETMSVCFLALHRRVSGWMIYTIIQRLGPVRTLLECCLASCCSASTENWRCIRLARHYLQPRGNQLNWNLLCGLFLGDIITCCTLSVCLLLLQKPRFRTVCTSIQPSPAPDMLIDAVRCFNAVDLATRRAFGL